MDIYFLRHANAGEPKLSPAKDEKRPIDKLGIEQSHDVGRALAALDVIPDVIISSPLRRATQTAAVVANELGYEDKVITDPALRPEASYEKFQDLLRRHSRKDAIMVVGHNPSMTDVPEQTSYAQRRERSCHRAEEGRVWPRWKKTDASPRS